MSFDRTPMSTPPNGHDAENPQDVLIAHLEALEEALVVGGPVDPTRVEALEASLRAADDARRDPALLRRADRALALGHLRARDVPDPLLEDLCDTVLAQAAGAPERRAQMSRAFLDAPRSLRRWRMTGAAACVLVGVLGVMHLQSPTPRERGAGERPMTLVPGSGLPANMITILPTEVDLSGDPSAPEAGPFSAASPFSDITRPVDDAPLGDSGDPNGRLTRSFGVEQPFAEGPVNRAGAVLRAFRSLFDAERAPAPVQHGDLEHN